MTISTSTLFPPNPSPKVQTVIAYLDAYQNLSIEETLAQLSPSSFEYFSLPESLPGGPTSNLTKDSFAQRLRDAMPKTEAFKVTKVHEIIENEEKVVLRASSILQLVSGGTPKETQDITIFHFHFPSEPTSDSSNPKGDSSNDAQTRDIDANPKPLISCMICFYDSLALLNMGLRAAAVKVGEESAASKAFNFLDVPPPPTTIVTRR